MREWNFMVRAGCTGLEVQFSVLSHVVSIFFINSISLNIEIAAV